MRRARHGTRLRLLTLETRLAPAALSVYGPYSPDQLAAAERLGVGAWVARAGGAVNLPGAEEGVLRALPLGLDEPAIRGHLAAAPVELALPRPDGGFERFHVWEVPTLDTALAARYPGIRTYRGQGADDPAAVLAADVTYQGFHARVLSARGGFAVEPTAAVSAGDYQAFFDSDYQFPHTPGCGCAACAAAVAGLGAGTAGGPAGGGPTPFAVNEVGLRTFRAAISTTGEYTAKAGGTVALGLSAVTTVINNVNATFERDFAVRMTLVPNNDDIIYTNAATDPYSGGVVNMLVQNQTATDLVIDPANYDIGHVFGTGNLGGVAYIGVVGLAFYKAKGVSTTDSSGNPTNTWMTYVASHEMGHMYFAGHTFNGVSSTLTPNRMAASAWEPGSGSTIMGYGGLGGGGQDYVPAGSATYFHGGSIGQVRFLVDDYIPSVGTETGTGNEFPVVHAGADRAIPAGTHFALTAAMSDADGDALTLAWEQVDLGPALALGAADNGKSPLFRSWPPAASPTRYFPTLADQLANKTTAPEVLPSTNRTLTFRATVRDNKAGGGGVAQDNLTLTVVATGAPFKVTAPNTNVSWAAGTSQTVTWDVAGTTAAPISAGQVNIRLSTDGGQTWPTLLVANTPNDGSEAVIVPNMPTGTARVKVEPVGNYFYDFSNVNFTITDPPTSEKSPGTGGVPQRMTQ